MQKFALFALVVALSNGVNPLEESLSEEHRNKIPRESQEKTTENVRNISKYWENNTPFKENDSEEVSREDEIHIKEQKEFFRKQPLESSEEEIIKKRPKQKFKKPYIDAEEDEDLKSTTRKPYKKIRPKIVMPTGQLSEYHDYDYAEDPVGAFPRKIVFQPLPVAKEVNAAGPSKRHRHRKKPRRIIYIDSGESIEIIRKSHNKRRPPQDYEEKDDEYYDDITTLTPEETQLKLLPKVKPEYRNNTITTVTSTSSPGQIDPHVTITTK
ncbi:unnamed protein product [Allacma fusca]|uniref:Uncharacterized protein n=1 Tax=Allacma fusca TaxID=39272 RepID=A0A8J2PML0_9HEXA|nr:unnamed protein product [Allacma fusca]